MPDSMISEATGSNSNVIGSRSATVAVDQMPGSTPTAVPSVTPRRQIRMLEGCRAVSRPRRMPSTSAPEPVADDRKTQLQQTDEDHETHGGKADRNDQSSTGTGLLTCQRGQEGRGQQ